MNVSHQLRPGAARRRRISQACVVAVMAAVSMASDCNQDITEREDRVVARIDPADRVDTTFVGDVISYVVPRFYTAANGTTPVGGFGAQWSSSNAAVAAVEGSATQAIPVECLPDTESANCKNHPSIVIDAKSAGEAVVTMVPTGVSAVPNLAYKHRLYVLAGPPDILDAPSFLRIRLGDSTLLYAAPRTATGPLVTTGTTSWVAPQPAIAAIRPIANITNPTLTQSFTLATGVVISSPTLPVIVKGVSAGQAPVVAIWEHGGRKIQKTITVIVVPPSVTIAAVPAGPANDLSNSQVPVQVGTTRQYRALDEDDAPVAATWKSLTPDVAEITATGLATCRNVGPAQINAARTGTSQTSTVILNCFAAPQPFFAITPSVLALASGERSGLAANVTNVAPGYSIAWSTSDESVVTVAGGSTSASVVGSGRLLRDAPATVSAVLTAGSTVLRAESRITVAAAPLVVLPKQPAPLAAGQTQTFTLNTVDGLTNTPVPNTEVDWSSSDVTVATVSSGGVAQCGTSKPAGGVVVVTATITRTTRSATAQLTCSPSATVATIAVTPVSARLAVGQTVSLTAALLNAPVTAGVTWEVDAPAEQGIVSFAAAPTGPFTASLTGPRQVVVRGDKAGVAHVAVRYKQGTTTVAEAIATITVDAPAGSVVAAVVLEPVAAEITLPANIQYVAHLFTAQGVEVTAASDGGSIQYAAAQPSILLVNPATGLAIGSGVGVTTVTASYVRSGVATKTSLPSQATVYAAGTQGHYASVVVSTPNDTRVIKVGQAPMTFQVIIKDQAGNQVKANIGGGVDVTTSDPALVTAYQPAIPGGVFYTMQATKLPATSAVAGIPNVVLLKVDIFGAMITIPMLVVP